MDGPFFFYNSAFPAFLYEEKLTIVISTYQAGKVLFISSVNGKALTIYAKNFQRPMGIAVKQDKLAIAHRSKIDIFSGSSTLAKGYQPQPNHYDKIFLPQVSYNTGMADIHEIEWGNDGLWAVNTMFSCLCKMDDEYSFIPKWHPPFISEISPEDRCHLNGMAMKEGEPAFVTTFDNTDDKDGWRNKNPNTGQIIDIRKNEILAKDLPMPHSPVYHDGKLYYLLSASGEIVSFDIAECSSRTIATIDGYLRGLEVYKGYLIVGMSSLRKTFSDFQDVNEKSKTGAAGIHILDIETGSTVAKITFIDYIREIFSVKTIERVQRPVILTPDDEESHKFIHLPDQQDYWLNEQKNKD
jgi:uncharacterized protein (TIGR03032 family)